MNGSMVDWRILNRSEHFEAESEWRSIFGKAWIQRSRMRRGVKAEAEYLQQPCEHYLIVPFTANVEGTPIHVYRQAISAYECQGRLISLVQFCDAEFFVSTLNFEWTLVHTHEDYAIDGPYFVRREWVV
jgi:hypothetical protein